MYTHTYTYKHAIHTCTPIHTHTYMNTLRAPTKTPASAIGQKHWPTPATARPTAFTAVHATAATAHLQNHLITCGGGGMCDESFNAICT